MAASWGLTRKTVRPNQIMAESRFARGPPPHGLNREHALGMLHAHGECVLRRTFITKRGNKER